MSAIVDVDVDVDEERTASHARPTVCAEEPVNIT
jgi:hypothetical protein